MRIMLIKSLEVMKEVITEDEIEEEVEREEVEKNMITKRDPEEADEVGKENY